MKGHVYQRGKTWTYVVDIGIDPASGKRKQKSKGGFKRQKDAQAALTKIMAEIQEGSFMEPSKETVANFLTRWIESKKRRVQESTYLTQEAAIRNHIIPQIGRLQLDRIQAAHVEKLYTHMLEEKQLHAYTVKRVHHILNGAFDHAVKQGLMKRNVAEHVYAPKAPAAEIQTWSEEQIQTFWNASKHTRYHIAFVLAATTGMRKGEVLGLRWQDIDWDAKRLYVRQILSSTHKLTAGGKTSQSVRSIALSDVTIEELRKQHLVVKKDKLKLGKAYLDHDLVVCSKSGRWVRHATLLNWFYEWMNRTGVPRIRFHDLRHTHATLLLQAGVNPKVVSERLGHSNITITLNTYSHVLPTMQEAAAQTFEDLLFRSVK